MKYNTDAHVLSQAGKNKAGLYASQGGSYLQVPMPF